MKMRKLFAGLAAAATLLGGMAFGAGSANAATTPALPYKPLANSKNADGTSKYDKVDANGKVLENATFKFTADSAENWGTNNNREIKAYKLADYYQYVGDNKKAVFGVQAVDGAKTGVLSALKTALANTAKNPDDTTAGEHDSADGTKKFVTVPEGDNAADPLAWALQYGYLDQSANKPWTMNDSKSDTESTTRKFADALDTFAGKVDAIRNLGRPVTLKVDADTSIGEIALTEVAKSDGKSYTADLPAGIYLFLDVTESGIDVNGKPNAGTATDQDKNWIQNGKENNANTKGEVVVNSVPIILASGHLTADTKKDDQGNDVPTGENYLYPIGDIAVGDNTVSFKNHVTPVVKTVDDTDKTVSTGQTVRYTLSSTLPLTTGYNPKTYVFTLQDFPGEGQTVNLDGFKDAKGNVVSKAETPNASNAGEYTVKVYDTDDSGNLLDGDKGTKGVQPVLLKTLTEGTDFDLATSANNGKEIVGAADKAAWFKLDFSKLIQQDLYNNGAMGTISDPDNNVEGTAAYDHLWGKKVVVEYAAKITADHGDVPNSVEVNDNNAVANHGTNLTLGEFTFFKKDAQGNAGEDINGATFVITRDEKTENNTAVTPDSPDFSGITDTNGDKKTDDDDIDHVRHPWGGAGINESDSRTASVWENGELKLHNGVVTFYGLADGTYTVKETRAPAGFLGGQVSVSFKVIIKGGKAVHFDGTDAWGLAGDKGDANGSNEVTDYSVKNVRNITELPKTGAAGIILFGVAGLLLAAAAVTVYLKSRATKRALYA